MTFLASQSVVKKARTVELLSVKHISHLIITIQTLQASISKQPSRFLKNVKHIISCAFPNDTEKQLMNQFFESLENICPSQAGAPNSLGWPATTYESLVCCQTSESFPGVGSTQACTSPPFCWSSNGRTETAGKKATRKSCSSFWSL